MALLIDYCEVYPGHTSKLPVCLLKFNKIPKTELKICPFLKPEFHTELENAITNCNTKEEAEKKMINIARKNFKAGKTKEVCSIHKNSPEVCKLYPLGRGTMIDKKTKKQTVKYFKLEKKQLLCDEKCFKHKNLVEDYLKSNDLIDPEKEELSTKYHYLLTEFAKMAIKQKEKFTDYRLLLMYLINFDLLFILQRFRGLSKEARNRIINNLDLSGNKQAMLKVLNEVKTFRLIDYNLLKKTLNKNATDRELKDFFRHLLDIYDDVLVKLKKKYAN